MSIQIIKETIKHYIRLSKNLTEDIDDDSYNKIISIIVGLEEEILTYFGLPPSAFQYTSELERITKLDASIDVVVDIMYSILENHCINGIFAPFKSNKQILKDGRSMWLDAQEVLPFIGYNVNDFNRFLFHDIYCKNHCDERKLLRYLRLEQKLEVTQRHTHPYFRKYLRYLYYIQNKRLIEIISESPDFEQEYHETAVLSLSKFHVIAIDVQNPTVSTMDIAIFYHARWLALRIWCTLPQVQYILRYAKYAIEVSKALLALRYNDYDQTGYSFNINRLPEGFIEVQDINIELERLDRRNDDIKVPYDFVIAYVQKKIKSA